MTDRVEATKTFANRIAEAFSTHFAGAILIIPPEGDPAELILSSNKPDNAFFWAQVVSLVNVKVEEVEKSRRGMFG